MSKTDNNALPEVKPEVRQLADGIKALAKKAKIENGKIVLGSDFFAQNQQEGLNVEDAKKYKRQHDTFVHGLALATGELGNELAAKDKALEDLSITLGTVERDGIEQKWLRTKEISAPGSDEKKIVHGYLERPKIVSASTRPSGEFKKIREIVIAGAKNLSK